MKKIYNAVTVERYSASESISDALNNVIYSKERAGWNIDRIDLIDGKYIIISWIEVNDNEGEE